MPYSIDFKIQNTNSEAVDVDIELTDPTEQINPIVYSFTNIQPGTTVLNCNNIPDDQYFNGTVKFKPRGASEFLESLPVSINRFRTDPPIINVGFTIDTSQTGSETSYNITLPTTELNSSNRKVLNVALNYTDSYFWEGIGGGNNTAPLPIPIDPDDPNHLWRYDLIPNSGLTADQTKLVFNPGLSSGAMKAYDVTTVTNSGGTVNMVIYLVPFLNEPSFNNEGAKILIEKPASTTTGVGEFDLRFELQIQGIDDPNWASLETYDGIRNDDQYLSSYLPQITHTQTIKFTIQ